MDKDIIDKFAENDAHELLLAGTWIATAGNVISASGETKRFITRDILAREGVVVGNGVEAFGNVLQGIGRGKIYDLTRTEATLLGTIGCWLQAIGNTTNAVATQESLDGELLEEAAEEIQQEGNESGRNGYVISEIINEEIEEGQQLQDEGERLDAFGSSVQSFGAALEAYGVALEKPYPTQDLEMTANILIGLGSAIEAIGNVAFLQGDEERADLLKLVGIWIEVIGAAMEVYSVTIELSTEGNENINSYGRYNASFYS